MKQIKFHKPNISKKEISSVVKVIKSGWLTTGQKVKEFEKDFTTIFKKKVYCSAINSCTSGLFLALKACGVKKGDEVITSNLTFTSTISSIYHCGAKPVIVDINPENLNLCIDEVKKKINKKTKCIIAVHYAGYPVDLGSLKKIIKNRNIKIIDDAAHCLPSKYKDTMIGETISDISVFSFYVTKTITTGEGGMVVSRNKKLIDFIKKNSFHGIDKDVYSRYNTINKQWNYDVKFAGYKFNMTDINAALGVEQLKKMFPNYKKRSKIFSTYKLLLNNNPLIKTPLSNNQNFQSSKHLFVIRISNNLRDKVAHNLVKNGIGVSLHYVPIHRHTFWKKQLKMYRKNYNNSEAAYKEMLSLPIYPDLKINDVKKICFIINHTFV